MPTVAEQLEKTQNSIKESAEALRASCKYKAEIQAQIDASREMLLASQEVLRAAIERVAAPAPEGGESQDA
jgi:hypothetical protein